MKDLYAVEGDTGYQLPHPDDIDEPEDDGCDCAECTGVAS